MRAAPVIPDRAEIQFAVYKPTGRVHVVCHEPEPWEDGVEIEKVSFAEGLQGMFETPRRMICGARFIVGLPGARGEWEDVFPDEDICGACVRVLGDRSARAFEHRRPGDEHD